MIWYDIQWYKAKEYRLLMRTEDHGPIIEYDTHNLKVVITKQ